jgi:hypothetical protein
MEGACLGTQGQTATGKILAATICVEREGGKQVWMSEMEVRRRERGDGGAHSLSLPLLFDCSLSPSLPQRLDTSLFLPSSSTPAPEVVGVWKRTQTWLQGQRIRREEVREAWNNNGRRRTGWNTESKSKGQGGEGVRVLE